MKTTTRAIQIDKPGGPEVLRAVELPLPDPAPGEVRLRHTAIGINYIDIYFRTGLYPVPAYPFVPGMEGAGVVETVGRDVRELKSGDRVAYASRPLGAYCERRNMPADRLVRIPAGVSDEHAAALMLKGMTAQYLLRRTFKVERGHTILVHAASGGVGSLLSPWAHHLGARVIGTVGSDAKAERALESGCDHAIVYTRESFVERVKAITDGAGVNVVYDSVGKDTFAGSIECLASLGMLVSFGQSSGPIPPFDLGLLAKRSLFLTRPSLLDYTAKREDLMASSAEMFEMVKRGVLRAHVGRLYPLLRAADAHRDLESRQTSGSSILMP